MKKRCAMVITLILGCGLSAGALADGNYAAGQAKSAMCAACHGPDGNSVSPSFPKLAGQHAAYIEKQLADFKSGKRQNAIMNGMAAGLSPQDMANLAAYFSDQRPTPGTAQGDAKTIALGQKLYRGGDRKTGLPACMSCHGPAGSGIPPKFPRVGGQWAAYVQAQLQAFHDGTRSNDEDGVMRTIAGKLTPKDIAAVSQYIAGLRVRAPAKP